MPRRSKSTKPARPEKPGRFIPGYGDNETEDETIEFPIDDKQLHRIADEMKALGAKINEQSEAVAKARNELKPLLDRNKQLVESLATGTLEERREVYKFADDEKGTVALYDAKTHELLHTREIEHWERQEEMNFEENEPEEGGEEAGDGDED